MKKSVPPDHWTASVPYTVTGGSNLPWNSGLVSNATYSNAASVLTN